MLLQSFIALGFASLELHHLQEAFETMGGRPGAEAWPAPDPKTPRHPTFGNSKVVRTVRFLRLLRLLSMFEQLIAIVWIPFFEIAQCQAAPWQTEGPLRRLWGMLQSCKDEIFCPDGHIQILVGACWIVWNFFGRSEVTRRPSKGQVSQWATDTAMKRMKFDARASCWAMPCESSFQDMHVTSVSNWIQKDAESSWLRMFFLAKSQGISIMSCRIIATYCDVLWHVHGTAVSRSWERSTGTKSSTFDLETGHQITGQLRWAQLPGRCDAIYGVCASLQSADGCAYFDSHGPWM